MVVGARSTLPRAAAAVLGLVAIAAGASVSCGGHREAGSQADAPNGAAAAEVTVPGPAPDSTAEGQAGAATVARATVEAPPPDPPPPSSAAGSCPSKADDGVALVVSPKRPGVGTPLRILAATLSGTKALALRLEDDNGEPIEVEVDHRGGIPASVLATVVPQQAGRMRVVVGRDGSGLRCATIRVATRAAKSTPRDASPDSIWPLSREWSAAEEALYGAWLRELFHAPRGEELAFGAWHEVTSQSDRNVLFDYYGWGEDDRSTPAGLYLRPDCADAPYFYRAYYAWKRGLPFAFRQCSRGKGKAPRCGRLQTMMRAPDSHRDPDRVGELAAVQRFFKRTIAWGVHSGNGRTAFADDRSDLYALELDARALRPGVVYADPYGHTFVIVELVPPRGAQPGVLYAVDGQPDGSITRKRFWEGNFLWNPDPVLGGSGFKAFRPVVTAGDGDARRLVALSNAEISARDDYGDVSDGQAKLDAPGFYDLVESLVTPGRRDAFVVQREAVRALHEAAQVRVTSVENGERYHKDHPSKVIAMPDGAEIFETSGPWENYSTPARDLRLLIAIGVVTDFDAKVARQPKVYGVAQGPEQERLRAELRRQRERLLAADELAFSYTSSAGSPVRLTLAELISRSDELERAYNPNDCPEVRWGATPGSVEAKPCRRRAPPEQQRKMEAYRVWFRERRRPPRGDPGPPVPGNP